MVNSVSNRHGFGFTSNMHPTDADSMHTVLHLTNRLRGEKPNLTPVFCTTPTLAWLYLRRLRHPAIGSTQALSMADSFCLE